MEEEEFLFKLGPIMYLEYLASKQYEDKDLMTKIRNAIPKDIYIGKNMTQMIAVGRLMRWFKTFMKWVPRGGWTPDPTTCRDCRSEMDMDLLIGSWTSERDWSANWEQSRLEKWSCSKCGHTFELPRYNNLSMLLETREGRCGEWARLYTAMLISLGIEATLILDKFNDHVWTEVLPLPGEERDGNRWIAIDVSDGHMDDPLVYERRFGKEFFYILAFSPGGFVKDVTKRYTAKMEETRERRKHEGRVMLLIEDFYTWALEDHDAEGTEN